MTVIQELEQKAGQLPEFQRAALASKLLATLPPVLHDADDGVAEALLKVADSYIQLLTPVSETSPVAKYLASKGEGLHHIGYRVADCAVALEAVKAAGGRVIDEKPRPGSRGTTVAFVHPKTSFGTLIELVQDNGDHH